MAMFESPSPERSDSVRLGAADGLPVRRAVESDLDAIAEISAERHGEDFGRWRRGTERLFREAQDGSSGALYVASLADEIIGHGKATYFVPPESAPENCNPEGWHLSGVLVRPRFRRRGVGTALTRARLTWLAERTDCVDYFASLQNTVSIEMHRALGFEEVRRGIWHPGVSFTGGVGVLFRLRLPRPEGGAAPRGGS